MAKSKSFTAWAIDHNSDEGHGFAGRYWWFMGRIPTIPPHMEGCRVALFTTRKIAKENLKWDKSKDYIAFPKSKVVKVKVTITELPPTRRKK